MRESVNSLLNMRFLFRVSATCWVLAWAAGPAHAQVDETPAASLGEPAAGEPAADEPATDEAATDEAATDDPAMDQPPADELGESASAGMLVESPPEAVEDTEVEGAEHLSSGSARGDSSRPVYASSSERRRRLIFVAEGRQPLFHRLTLQLPDWQVRQVSVEPTYLRVWRARAQLMPGDVVVWIETGDEVARVALLDASAAAPRSSSLPAAENDEGWSRAFALVVEGLIREQATAHRETDGDRRNDARESREHLLDVRVYGRPVVRARPRRRRSWMRSPVARDGWMFRFGWSQGFTPRRGGRGGFTREVHVSGGLRVAAGRWVHPNVRLSLAGDFAWANEEPEGAFGLQAMVVSSTRLRIGGGVEASALIVSEREPGTGNRFGWVGYRFGVPLELGVEVNGKGGIFVHLGPTFTKAPYSDGFKLGYQLSMEWEFN